jgi:hypothetical protein
MVDCRSANAALRSMWMKYTEYSILTKPVANNTAPIIRVRILMPVSTEVRIQTVVITIAIAI